MLHVNTNKERTSHSPPGQVTPSDFLVLCILARHSHFFSAGLFRPLFKLVGQRSWGKIPRAEEKRMTQKLEKSINQKAHSTN